MAPELFQYRQVIWEKKSRFFTVFYERLYLYDISRVSYIYSVKSVFLPILLSLPFCPLILFCLFYQEYYVHFASSTYRAGGKANSLPPWHFLKKFHTTRTVPELQKLMYCIGDDYDTRDYIIVKDYYHFIYCYSNKSLATAFFSI